MKSPLIPALLFTVLIFITNAAIPSCPPSKEIIRYPYDGNCTLFWQCYDGNRFVLTCPEGKEFNIQTSQCDNPAAAKCNPNANYTTARIPSTSRTPPSTIRTTITTANPTTITTALPTTIPASPSTSVTIPSTTNPTLRTTDATTSLPSSTQNPYPLCPKDPSEDQLFFPIPGDCRDYMECFKGVRYNYRCAQGSWFNPEKKRCDYPGNYCTPSLTTNAPSSVGPQPVDCSKDSIWPVMTDCARYIQCSGGKEYLFTCPNGTYYSAAKVNCVYKTQSECCTVNINRCA